jgi:hypothetical protein
MDDVKTEERLQRIEQLLDRAIELARKSAFGRRILAMLEIE